MNDDRLKTHQLKFYEALKSPAQTPETKKFGTEFREVFGTPTPSERFNIYRNNYRSALCHSLASTYWVCQELVGKEFFQEIALEYLENNPSRSPDLNDYGADFGDFLVNHLHTQDLAYLPDVAKMEWAIHYASRTREENPHLDFDTFRRYFESRDYVFTMDLPCSATLINSLHPIQAIWNYHQINESERNGEIDNLFGEDIGPLIIWRSNENVRVDRIEQTLFPMLKHLKKHPGTSGLESLTDLYFDQLLNLPIHLKTLIERKWLLVRTSS
jgi:hypothetical protein